MKSQQSGFAHAFLIIGLVVVLVGALGFVFWQNFIYKEPVVTKTATVKTDKEAPKTESNIKTFTDEGIGITFQYPKDWIKYRCTAQEITANDLNPDVVYFSTSKEGLGITDGSEHSSLLCGGGSDFLPQMSFQLTPGGDGDAVGGDIPGNETMVDGKKFYKNPYTYEDGDFYEKGTKTLYYTEGKSTLTRSFVFSYVEYPSLKETPSAQDDFVKAVEQSLKFL